MLLILTALFVEISSKKPNVLFIMLDDLGWGDVSWNNDKVIAMIYSVIHKIYLQKQTLEG